MNIKEATAIYKAECKRLGFMPKRITGMTKDMWSDDIELSSYDETCVCIMTNDGTVLSIRHNIKDGELVQTRHHLMNN